MESFDGLGLWSEASSQVSDDRDDYLSVKSSEDDAGSEAGPGGGGQAGGGQAGGGEGGGSGGGFEDPAEAPPVRRCKQRP